MYRILATCLALCLSVAISGCKSSPESQDATVAVGGMMPAGEATPEIMYAVDQAEIKVLPERTIPSEPLSVFRAKLEESRAAEAAKMAASAPAGAGDSTEPTTAAGEPEKKSVWGSVTSLLGGKMPGEPTASDESPKTDASEKAAPENDNGSDDDDQNDNADSDDDW